MGAWTSRSGDARLRSEVDNETTSLFHGAGGLKMSPSFATKRVGLGVAPDSMVVALVGELDMARDGELLATVVALDAPPGTTVDLECSQVTFIDSRGLVSVFKAKAYLERHGCPLRVINPRQQFLRILELTDLAGALTVIDGGDATSDQ